MKKLILLAAILSAVLLVGCQGSSDAAPADAGTAADAPKAAEPTNSPSLD